MLQATESGLAVVLGVGAAVSVLAASHGLHVFVVGRTQSKLDKIVEEIEAGGGAATAVVADCTDADEIQAVFEQIAASGQPLCFAVHNMAAPNMPTEFLKTDIEFFETHWRRATFGGFLAAQAVVKQMMKQKGMHRGTLIFTGASGSLRGKAKFSAFAAAKAGLRAMAQSIAREFGPEGIHVGHVIIDGIIDGQFVRDAGGNLANMWIKSKGKDGSLKPDEIAKAYWMLHEQERSAWTHELDLRPYNERKNRINAARSTCERRAEIFLGDFAYAFSRRQVLGNLDVVAIGDCILRDSMHYVFPGYRDDPPRRIHSFIATTRRVRARRGRTRLVPGNRR